jgi:uncharacterized delta-60 repeat protein
MKIPVRAFPQRQFFICERIAVLAILLALTAALAAAQAGSLDSSFATGGIFTTSFTQVDETLANVMAIQSDGKILVAGFTPSGGTILRLNTNGTPDGSFGTGGFVNVNNTTASEVFGLAILPNGQILVGTAGIPNAILRLNSNGTLDTTFGANGYASTKSLADLAPETPQSFLALLPNGEILETGNQVMGKFTSSGQLDPTFGNLGIAGLTAPNVTAIAAQPNGKILVASGLNLPSNLNLPPFLPVIQAGTITRYNANGALDNTFGASGQAACTCSATALAVESDGKFVVAGTITTAVVTAVSNGVTSISNQTGFGLARYNANGAIDTTFNHGGAVVGFGSSFPVGAGLAVAIQANGEIVVAGDAGVADFSGSGPGLGSSSFALARFTSAGQLDSSFGEAGTVLTEIGGAGYISYVSALTILSNGDIVAAGNTAPFVYAYSGLVDNFAVARYLGQ